MKITKSVVLLTFVLLAQSALAQYIGENKRDYGASYYPESWPAESVDADIRLIKEANINVVRMAEFSWSLIEPSAGTYEFQWLHKIIDELHANGIAVIFGTPTATPPVWLWKKYPEIGRIDEDGRQAEM